MVSLQEPSDRMNKKLSIRLQPHLSCRYRGVRLYDGAGKDATNTFLLISKQVACWWNLWLEAKIVP